MDFVRVNLILNTYSCLCSCKNTWFLSALNMRLFVIFIADEIQEVTRQLLNKNGCHHLESILNDIITQEQPNSPNESKLKHIPEDGLVIQVGGLQQVSTTHKCVHFIQGNDANEIFNHMLKILSRWYCVRNTPNLCSNTRIISGCIKVELT